MQTYPIHTIDSAPDGAKQSLEALHTAFGMIPNLAATMANSPALVNTFVAAFGQFAGTSLSGAERQILLMSNAVANKSAWPVAFHSTLALREGVAAADVEAIRGGHVPSEPRLAALSTITRRLIETRGHLDEGDVKSFLAAGFDDAELFDVITGVAVSAMANYTSNVARPQLEQAFQAQVWKE